MAPVKLGLKAGQTIPVEDALKAMVTKSANDAAAVVAEAIGGGDEAEGARLMTAKARALGMSGTTYVNGSGLPAEEQITTARDQALLGLIIHNRFPNYYTYFSTLSFNYHGREMHNHNGLLGNVKGVDGIKTGYTEASGYNLVASVSRDDRHIVAVVLGGTSNGQRDNLMRKLIEEHILRASAQRVAPAITEVASANGALGQSDRAGHGRGHCGARAGRRSRSCFCSGLLRTRSASARVPAPALASVPAATAIPAPLRPLRPMSSPPIRWCPPLLPLPRWPPCRERASTPHSKRIESMVTGRTARLRSRRTRGCRRRFRRNRDKPKRRNPSPPQPMRRIRVRPPAARRAKSQPSPACRNGSVVTSLSKGLYR